MSTNPFTERYRSPLTRTDVVKLIAIAAGLIAIVFGSPVYGIWWWVFGGR